MFIHSLCLSLILLIHQSYTRCLLILLVLHTYTDLINISPQQATLINKKPTLNTNINLFSVGYILARWCALPARTFAEMSSPKSAESAKSAFCRRPATSTTATSYSAPAQLGAKYALRHFSPLSLRRYGR